MTVYVVVASDNDAFVAVFGTFFAALKFISSCKGNPDYFKIVPAGVAR